MFLHLHSASVSGFVLGFDEDDGDIIDDGAEDDSGVMDISGDAGRTLSSSGDTTQTAPGAPDDSTLTAPNKQTSLSSKKCTT